MCFYGRRTVSIYWMKKRCSIIWDDNRRYIRRLLQNGENILFRNKLHQTGIYECRRIRTGIASKTCANWTRIWRTWSACLVSFFRNRAYFPSSVVELLNIRLVGKPIVIIWANGFSSLSIPPEIKNLKIIKSFNYQNALRIKTNYDTFIPIYEIFQYYTKCKWQIITNDKCNISGYVNEKNWVGFWVENVIQLFAI